MLVIVIVAVVAATSHFKQPFNQHGHVHNSKTTDGCLWLAVGRYWLP